MKKLILCITIIQLLPALLFAQFGAELQQGARQQGLGEAFTGLADDGKAVYYNPAGLANLKFSDGMLSYSRQLAHLTQGEQGTGINVSYLGFAHNFGDKIGSLAVHYYYRGAQFEEVFNASEHIFMTGYGRSMKDVGKALNMEFLEPLSLGIGAKFMKSGFYDAPALLGNDYVGNKTELSTWAWSMDLSMFYELNKAWSFGFLYKDFNRPNTSMLSKQTYLDLMDYSIGVAWRYGNKGRDLVSLDVVSENTNYGFNVGTEKVWDFKNGEGKDEVILRTGGKVGFEEDYNWTIGAGYLLNDIGKRMDLGFDLDMRIDYAYKVMFGDISDAPGNHTWEMVFMIPKEEPKPIVLAPSDRDKDGIIDIKDLCPDNPEDFDGFQDIEGCPDPDNDKDGILDVVDKCANEPEDIDGFEDIEGCPDPDNDKDGILDVADKCPNDAEDFDGFDDIEGCPDPDNDQDGILDVSDKCPNEPETVNGFNDTDGCPDMLLKKNTKFALNNVYFAKAKVDLTEASFIELNKLGQLFTDYPKLTVMIEGHTDNVGNAASNKKLSLARAKSVTTYLVNTLKIDASRFKSAGYGSEKPAVKNNTPENKAKNRRIEFKVLTIE